MADHFKSLIPVIRKSSWIPIAFFRVTTQLYGYNNKFTEISTGMSLQPWVVGTYLPYFFNKYIYSYIEPSSYFSGIFISELLIILVVKKEHIFYILRVRYVYVFDKMLLLSYREKIIAFIYISTTCPRRGWRRGYISYFLMKYNYS